MKKEMFFLVGVQGRKEQVLHVGSHPSRSGNTLYHVIFINGAKDHFADILQVQPQATLVKKIRQVLAVENKDSIVASPLLKSYVKKSFSVEVSDENSMLLCVPGCK